MATVKGSKQYQMVVVPHRPLYKVGVFCLFLITMVALSFLTYEYGMGQGLATKVAVVKEKDEIRHVLKEFSAVKEEDIPLIMASIEMAAKERIDLYSFTSEVSANLNREKKNDILKILFRIACIDKDLDLAEHEIIRTISNLFRLDHKEFIDAKIEVKKELGL